jgi:hypothetical protein
MFYNFAQNNSGGSFIVDDLSAVYIIIEADSPDEANDIAVDETGIYFNGCNEGSDCPCCGDRWYPAWSDEYADKVPSVWENPVSEECVEVTKKKFLKHGDLIIVYKKEGVKYFDQK